MTYTACYTASDMSAVTIDLIVTGLSAVLTFATVIVLVWILVYLKHKLR